MAFDQLRYDLTAFNIGGSGGLFISGLVSEKITASIGLSQELYINMSAFDRTTVEKAVGGNGAYISGFSESFIDAVEGIIVAESSIVMRFVTEVETLYSQVTVNAIVNPRIQPSETIVSDGIEIGHTAHIKCSSEEIFEGSVTVDKETYLIASAYELMYSSASLEAVDILVCKLNLTLQPGQRLIVDADNYNVLLDGENAIEALTGDWIDELTRSTTSISINAASGSENLIASMLFTERYL